MEDNNVMTTEVTDVTTTENSGSNLGAVIALAAAAGVGSLATIGIQKGSKAVKKLWKKHKDKKAAKKAKEDGYVDGEYEDVDSNISEDEESEEE